MDLFLRLDKVVLTDVSWTEDFVLEVDQSQKLNQVLLLLT